MKLKTKEKEEQSLHEAIGNYLLKRKFNPRHKGCFYLHSAIRRSMQNKGEPLILNKLFMDIANDYRTFPVQVYKDIRYAMDKSLDSKFAIKEFIVIAVFELSN